MNTDMQNVQGEQPKGTQVNPYLVVESYKGKVDELTHREVMLTAYVRQLENNVKELNEKLEQTEQREQELACRVQELEQKELEQDELKQKEQDEPTEE